MAKKTAAGGKRKSAAKGPSQPQTKTPGWNGPDNNQGKFAGQKNTASKFTGARIEKKRG